MAAMWRAGVVVVVSTAALATAGQPATGQAIVDMRIKSVTGTFVVTRTKSRWTVADHPAPQGPLEVPREFIPPLYFDIIRVVWQPPGAAARIVWQRRLPEYPDLPAGLWRIFDVREQGASMLIVFGNNMCAYLEPVVRGRKLGRLGDIAQGRIRLGQFGCFDDISSARIEGSISNSSMLIDIKDIEGVTYRFRKSAGGWVLVKKDDPQRANVLARGKPAG